jgi:hypothetical protein
MWTEISYGMILKFKINDSLIFLTIPPDHLPSTVRLLFHGGNLIRDEAESAK